VKDSVPLLIVAGVVLAASAIADRHKTVAGVRRGVRMFVGILPSLLTVLILVSMMLSVFPGNALARWMGRDSGPTGFVIAALLGSVALIPGFIAYPLSAILVKNGVGYNVIAVFITTLMMVGVLTLPLEARYFGLRTAVVRNSLSLLGALVVGGLMGLLW
jgi:uncharacterized membrane protein YraQ (UPF0718 family)